MNRDFFLGGIFASLLMIVMFYVVEVIFDSASWSWEIFLPLVTAIVTFSGVVVAVSNFNKSLAASRDKEIIEIYSRIVEQASAILSRETGVSDKKSDWVAAARLLFKAEKYIAQVMCGSYRDVALSEKLSSTFRFRKNTQLIEEKLPETFFSGSGYQVGSFGCSAYQGITENGSKWIHDWSVIIIYKYALETYDFSYFSCPEFVENNGCFRVKMEIIGQKGVSKYLFFRKNFKRINGLVYKDGKKKSCYEIDSFLEENFPFDGANRFS